MKNKTPLVLMELVIMLLVFAVAAGLCLRAFAGAERISRTGTEDDRAVAAAQNGAELTKFYAGDLETAAAERGGAWDGMSWRFTVDGCPVTVTLLHAESPYLGTAAVTAGDIELTVSWQKEGTYE